MQTSPACAEALIVTVGDFFHRDTFLGARIGDGPGRNQHCLPGRGLLLF
jgi:hypothetical protein